MAIDFTNILITLADLRQRIGGPGTNVNSASYVSDTHLQNIIDLKKAVAEEIVERRMEMLTDEQIAEMDLKYDPIPIAVTAGTLLASSFTPDANLPVHFKAIAANGRPLTPDPDIYSTASNYAGSGFTKYRYFIVGNDLRVLPNTSQTITIWLPALDAVRQILVADIIDQINLEIVQEARQMLQDRVNVASGFKIEAQNEGP